MYAFIFNMWGSVAVQEIKQRQDDLCTPLSFFLIDHQLFKLFIFFFHPLSANQNPLIASNSLSHNYLSLLYSSYVARGIFFGEVVLGS